MAGYALSHRPVNEYDRDKKEWFAGCSCGRRACDKVKRPQQDVPTGK